MFTCVCVCVCAVNFKHPGERAPVHVMCVNVCYCTGVISRVYMYWNIDKIPHPQKWYIVLTEAFRRWTFIIVLL